MESIRWQNFNPTVLAAARQANRPILLAITASWCSHCKELMATTMRDPEVVQRIASGFVAIQVDADRRPDVNNRYGTGSWPTIAFLTSSGELIANEGYLEAPRLTQALDKVQSLHAENSAELEKGLRELWSHKADAAERPPQGKLRQEMVEDIAHAIYDKFDHRYGGWGDSSKFPHPESLDFAMIMVAKRNDDRMRGVVTLTLDKMMEGGIHDHVDGGFYRFSKTPDWREPNYEKVLAENATRLRCYLEGYQLFGTQAYRKVSEGIIGWMEGFMSDPDTGAFFGSQDADADYYVLDRQRRRDRNPPTLDRTIYTHANAIAVSSLLKASVVLERPICATARCARSASSSRTS